MPVDRVAECTVQLSSVQSLFYFRIFSITVSLYVASLLGFLANHSLLAQLVS